MKRIALALLVSATALAAHSARADTRVSFGLNVGSHDYCPPPVVGYAPAPTVVYAAPSRGYWKDVVVKTWVPERWVMSRDRWGRSFRAFEPGYFDYRTDRVWVDASGHRGPHGNAYGYHRNHSPHGGWNR